MSHRDRNDESGAVAVAVALLSFLLMIIGALAVDLGNSWARGRVVQRQADVAAIGAGSLLPMSTTTPGHTATDIARKAAELLYDNQAAGQSFAAERDVAIDQLGSDLLDSDKTNGDLVFSRCNEDGDTCAELSLTPPQAHVSFGLARVAGSSGTEIARSATVQVFSSIPPRDKVVPLWLPNGCGWGPVDGDTTQGGQSSSPSTTSSSPSPSPTSSSPTATSTQVPIEPVGTHYLSGTSAYTVAYGGSIPVKNLSINNVTPSTKKASIRAISPDGTFYNEYASADIKQSGSTFTVADFTIATEMTHTPGVWRLYAVVENNAKIAYSSNVFTVTVGAAPSSPASPSASATTASASATPSSIPVGCAGQSRGNFGQLDSPRAGGVSGQTALALNFAVGLDHTIVPFDFGGRTPVKSCENGANPIDGGQWDNVSRDGNNCITGDPGNDGPWMYKGLIAGVNGKPGRLDATNGTTTCPAHPGSRSNATSNGFTINNDVLSCFLTNGATLADLVSDHATPSMLDPSVVNSPRFVWMPVVVATDRAQKEFQPVLDYVPAFITDETQAPTAASSNNGVEVNGSSVKVLRLFAFNKEALAPDEQAPEMDYEAAYANPVVHLVG